MTGVDYKKSTRDMFMKLFDYIQGENKKSMCNYMILHTVDQSYLAYFFFLEREK